MNDHIGSIFVFPDVAVVGHTDQETESFLSFIEQEVGAKGPAYPRGLYALPRSDGQLGGGLHPRDVGEDGAPQPGRCLGAPDFSGRGKRAGEGGACPGFFSSRRVFQGGGGGGGKGGGVKDLRLLRCLACFCHLSESLTIRLLMESRARV